MKHTLTTMVYLLLSCLVAAQNNNIEPLSNRLEVAIKHKKSIGQQTKNSFTGKNQMNAQELQISYLFVLSKDILGGFGIGLAGYHSPSNNTFPLDARLIVFPAPSNRALAIDVGLGYALPIESSFKSGHRANLGLTWRPSINGNRGIGLSAGYSRQHFRNFFSIFSPGRGVINNSISSEEFYIGLSYAF